MKQGFLLFFVSIIFLSCCEEEGGDKRADKFLHAEWSEMLNENDDYFDLIKYDFNCENSINIHLIRKHIDKPYILFTFRGTYYYNQRNKNIKTNMFSGEISCYGDKVSEFIEQGEYRHYNETFHQLINKLANDYNIVFPKDIAGNTITDQNLLPIPKIYYHKITDVAILSAEEIQIEDNHWGTLTLEKDDPMPGLGWGCQCK